MKKNVLIVPYSHQLGSTHTLLEIGNILKDSGYNVIFAGEGYYLKFARDEKFKVVNLREIPIDTYREHTDKGDFQYLNSDQIKEFVKEEVKLLKNLKIDLVIDTLRPTMFISTKIANVLRITINYAILTNYYALPFAIPESHILYKSKLLPPLYYILSKLAKPIRKMIYYKDAKPYREYLEKLGMSSRIDYQELVEGDKVFIYDVREFAPLKENAPDKYVYVGAIVHDIPAQRPTWLDKVIDQKAQTGAPIIYLSMGATGSLYPKVLLALRNYIKDVRNAIIVGNYCRHAVNSKEFEKSENIYLTKFAPATHILKYADVVVTHGGRGTIYHSLKQGIPLIGIPHQAEQEWNNKRLEELGLGINVSRVNFSSERLFVALDNLFKDYKLYKTRCERYSSIIKGYHSREIIENEVKKILH